MRELKGISASPGIAIGKVFEYQDETPIIPKYSIQQAHIEPELVRLEQAVRKASAELEHIKQCSEREKDQDISFLDSHLMMLNDADFHSRIKNVLSGSLVNVEWVLHMVTQEFIERFSAIADEYLRERTADLSDISRRLMNHLMGRTQVSLGHLDQQVVITGKDIMPSDAVTMNNQFVLGLALDAGGKTSHTAILARSFSIPAVLGLLEVSRMSSNGDTIIVDGNRGIVIINPDEETLTDYRRRKERFDKRASDMRVMYELPSLTADSILVPIKGNIEVPEEVNSVYLNGSDGVGLYRSEFLFLQPGRLPTEQTQYEAYKHVLAAMGGKAVTIRTLDLGGDKINPDLGLSEEKNPLLGWRAIRFCLSQVDIFKTQLRALYRASVHGNLKIMFPMISGVEELERALEIDAWVREELTREGTPFDDHVKIGCMIEIPSAALTADLLAKKVHFFSIGTNDLIQYCLAVDRGNQNIAYLYEPFHLGVLRLIKMVIDSAHANHIPVSMCGELAGDPLATLVLLGLGLDEFSMSPSRIPEVKKIIRKVTMSYARELAERVMAQTSFKDVTIMVQNALQEIIGSEEG